MIDTTKYTQILILKRHWTLAVTTALTVIALVVPVALGMPNVYRAATKLSVERQVTMTATQAQILNGLETRLQMLRNETLSSPYLSDIIERLDLYPELRREGSIETVINRVQRDISITPNSTINGNNGPTTLTFTIGFLGDDPEKVKKVADALAQFYIAQNNAMRSKQASKVVQDLDAQVREAKQQNDDANARLTNYLITHAGKLPEQQSIKSAALARVANELAVKQTRYNTLKGFESNYSLQIAAATSAPTATAVALTPEQQLAAAQLDLRNLLDQRAGESNARVIAARARILSLQEQIKRPSTVVKPTEVVSQLDIYKRELKDTQDELVELDKEIAKLGQTQGALEAEIAGIPLRNPALDELNRIVKVTGESLDTLQRSYNLAASAAQLDRSQESEEFRVLEPALDPMLPAGPNRASLIVGGIIAAIVLGLGMAIVRDQFDTSFHTLDELREFTQVPVLASIPDIVTNKHRVRKTAMVVVGACVLLISLAFVSVGAYSYAQRHAGLTRLVTK